MRKTDPVFGIPLAQPGEAAQFLNAPAGEFRGWVPAGVVADLEAQAKSAGLSFSAGVRRGVG